MAANLVSTASTSGPSRPFCALPASLFQLDGSLFNSPVQDKRRMAWERKGEVLHVSASRAANWVSRMGGTRVLHNAFGLKGLLVKQGSLVTFIVGRNAHFPQKLSDESDQGCVDSSLSEAPLTRLPACTENSEDPRGHQLKLSKKNTYVHRRSTMAFIFSSFIFFHEWRSEAILAQPSTVFREYVDAFDGYTFKFPQNWIQVRGAGADIFYRDPFVLDENLSVGFSSPSSSRYISVEDLGSPQEAGKKILRQYLTEFMSTRLGVRRESSILSTSSRIADDGRLYYQVEVNIKSYANNNELAVMPEDRVVRLEWDRRYLSVLGVENSRLYELRLQTPEKVFREEENDLREVMSSFRVMKVVD